MVVGMNGRFGAQGPTSDFDGSVGDHFVGVHVRLSAASSLPNPKREVVVQMPINHFLRCSDDEVADLRVKLFECDVGFCSGLLQHAKGSNDAQGHRVMADVKVEE